MNAGHTRLKLLSYLKEARPNGMDAQTLTDGLRYDGFVAAKKDTTTHELNLMADDGFVKSKLDALSKDRLLWHITDAGIQTALENGM